LQLRRLLLGNLLLHKIVSTSDDDRLTDPLSGAAHAANAIETALVVETLKKAGKKRAEIQLQQS
jgi:hypothetical protein